MKNIFIPTMLQNREQPNIMAVGGQSNYLIHNQAQTNRQSIKDYINQELTYLVLRFNSLRSSEYQDHIEQLDQACRKIPLQLPIQNNHHNYQTPSNIAIQYFIVALKEAVIYITYLLESNEQIKKKLELWIILNQAKELLLKLIMETNIIFPYYFQEQSINQRQINDVQQLIKVDIKEPTDFYEKKPQRSYKKGDYKHIYRKMQARCDVAYQFIAGQQYDPQMEEFQCIKYNLLPALLQANKYLFEQLSYKEKIRDTIRQRKVIKLHQKQIRKKRLELLKQDKIQFEQYEEILFR